LQIVLCHVLTTIANVSAEASCDAMSGTPAPLINATPQHRCALHRRRRS
jgi:hypothetical protein